MNTKGIETYKLTGLPKKDLVAELYNRYGKKLYGYAIHNWSVNEDESWDLIYKTLYKVIDSYQKYNFESEEKFASFVFKIFINYLRNHYRDRKRSLVTRETADLESAGGISTEAEVTEHKDPRLGLLTEELEKMESWERMLLLMRSQGMAYSEIMRYIDKPESTLRVYYQRLKEQISKKLHGKS